MKTHTVRDQLLEHASVLIRQRGYNGFSYRDLAELVGVKTSSIHYYFPAKDDLVLEVVRLYRERRQARLAAIDTSLPLAEQARRYVNPLRNGIELNQICLAGMLSAEVMVLPDTIRTLLQAHFQMNEDWIAGLLHRARRGCPAPQIGSMPRGTCCSEPSMDRCAWPSSTKPSPPDHAWFRDTWLRCLTPPLPLSRRGAIVGFGRRSLPGDCLYRSETVPLCSGSFGRVRPVWVVHVG